MTSRFNEAAEIVLGHESGYQNLYNDRGNWTSGKIGVGVNKGTKYGITAMTYPTLDIKNLTLDEARAIYKRDYWDKMNGDKLEPALALVAFDTAINSGVGKAIELLYKTDDVDTYLNLRLAFLRSLKLYRVAIPGNRKGKTYGQVWEERVALLREQAAQWKIIYPKSAPPASPQPQEAPSEGAPGVSVQLDLGQGFKAITERFEDDSIVVNPQGNKVYIRLK